MRSTSLLRCLYGSDGRIECGICRVKRAVGDDEGTPGQKRLYVVDEGDGVLVLSRLMSRGKFNVVSLRP